MRFVHRLIDLRPKYIFVLFTNLVYNEDNNECSEVQFYYIHGETVLQKGSRIGP